MQYIGIASLPHASDLLLGMLHLLLQASLGLFAILATLFSASLLGCSCQGPFPQLSLVDPCCFAHRCLQALPLPCPPCLWQVGALWRLAGWGHGGQGRQCFESQRRKEKSPLLSVCPAAGPPQSSYLLKLLRAGEGCSMKLCEESAILTYFQVVYSKHFLIICIKACIGKVGSTVLKKDRTII